MKRSLLVLSTLLTVFGMVMPSAALGFDRQAADPLANARAALPADLLSGLERTIADASTRGLPTTPLVDKALEGAAKGVPADRILIVIHQLVRDLAHARALIGDASATDVTAVADGLRRGVPEDAVRALQSASGHSQPIAVAVHTLADLLDRGVPVDNALDVLGAWRSQGASASSLRELPAAVERLIRQGVLPDQAASAVASAVRAGLGPGSARLPAAAGPPGRSGQSPTDRPPIPPGAGPPGGPPGGPPPVNAKKSGGG